MSELAKYVLVLLTLASCANPTAVPGPLLQPTGSPSMKNSSRILYPGIVIDSASEVLFARLQDGRLAAIQLATGTLVWESNLGYTPLLEERGLLAALAPSEERANGFRVAWFDAGQGAVSTMSDEIVLPDWVSVEPARGRSLKVSATSQGSDILLDWRAQAFYAGGARPTRTVLEAARKEASGRARVGWGSAAVEILPLSDSADSEALPPGLSELTSSRYRVLDEWRTTPLVVRDRAVTLELETSGEVEQLAAVSWDLSSGQRLGHQVLTSGKNLWVVASPDGESLFVTSPALNSQSLWSVYGLPDGEQAGSFEGSPRMLTGSRIGSAAVVLTDPGAGASYQLRAIELATGQTKWSLELLPAPRFLPPR